MSLERAFPIFRRGELRDETLTYFRNGLREMVNPETGTNFSEDEIAIATSDLTNWYAEANALDLVLLAVQSRGLWVADQIWPDRAADEWLYNRHGKMWKLAPLPASGGSGTATGVALVGSIFKGSTTLPDDTADYATDTAGRRYQVLFTKTALASPVTLSFKGIDTGLATNLRAGDRLKWQRAPLGAQDFTVDATFKGGVPVETSAEFARRLIARMSKKQGAGNRAEVRDVARSIDAGVSDAFIYACAYSAGSTHIALLGKRATVASGETPVGPLAKVPSAGTVAVVGAALTPPGTRLLPGQPFIITTGVVSQPTNVGLRIDIGSGWKDGNPWPIPVSAVATIGTVTTQLAFRVVTDTSTAKPVIGAPALMVWNEAISRWERLKVASVAYVSPGQYDVVLTAQPSLTVATGMYVSPETKRLDEIATATEAYFDSLGPGELVSDERLSRAYRYPTPSTIGPSSFAAAELGRWLKQGLGPALGALSVSTITPSTVACPTTSFPQDGPYKLTLGKLGIYPHL